MFSLHLALCFVLYRLVGWLPVAANRRLATPAVTQHWPWMFSLFDFFIFLSTHWHFPCIITVLPPRRPPIDHTADILARQQATWSRKHGSAGRQPTMALTHQSRLIGLWLMSHPMISCMASAPSWNTSLRLPGPLPLPSIRLDPRIFQFDLS